MCLFDLNSWVEGNLQNDKAESPNGGVVAARAPIPQIVFWLLATSQAGEELDELGLLTPNHALKSRNPIVSF